MKLSIQRTETATCTKILDQLTAKTDQLGDQVNIADDGPKFNVVAK